MSANVFARSVEHALESKVPKLNFFGGEPLLNPQFSRMLQTALEKGFSIMLATNCRPLAKEGRLTEFLDITRGYKQRIVIITATDKFHLKFFDPSEIVIQLRSRGYEIVVNDYSNHTVLLSESNCNNPELSELNTGFSCCNGSRIDNLGVLPDGSWTICPTSLEPFGSVFTHALPKIVEFKRGLSLRCHQGCTECLKDFKNFSKEFEATGATMMK